MYWKSNFRRFYAVKVIGIWVHYNKHNQFNKTNLQNVESESTSLSWPVDNLQMYTWMFVMMSNVSLFFSLKNILLILFRAAGKVPKARKGRYECWLFISFDLMSD